MVLAAAAAVGGGGDAASKTTTTGHCFRKAENEQVGNQNGQLPTDGFHHPFYHPKKYSLIQVKVSFFLVVLFSTVHKNWPVKRRPLREVRKRRRGKRGGV